ncbi:MAG: EamA family transporter, partial [Pseudomonadota bacterium]
MMNGKLLPLLAPPVFVVLWSTGFVGAKFGLPYAEPMTFLSIRFALAALALALLAPLLGEAWSKRHDWSGAALIGVLIHGLYLGSVFQAIFWGMGAALSALIVSLQPVAMVIFARFLLGETMAPRQWLGFALGMIGVGLVVGRNVDVGDA